MAAWGSRASRPFTRFSLLTWHFFRRFLDNDLISPNGDAHVGLSHTIAALLAPGLIVAVTVMAKYARWRSSWPEVMDFSVSDALLYVSLSMIILGLGAAITWDAFFLEPRDRYILSVLPVPGRLLAAAKLGALGLFLAIFAGAANVFPALLVPAMMLQVVDSASWSAHFLPLTIAQTVAPVLAGAWSVLAVVSVRGLLALLLPAGTFRRVAMVAQGALVLLFLGWLLSLSPFLDSSYGVLRTGGWMRDALPPMWFLGLYQYIIGNPLPAHAHLAATALVSVPAVALVAAVVLLLGASGRRLEVSANGYANDVTRSVFSRLQALAARLLVHHPLGRAVFSFTLTTLGRSTQHRLYVAGALGAAIAWGATGVFWEYARAGVEGLALPTTPTLQVQAILIFLVVAAVRFGALVPVALPANWLFRVTEALPTRKYHAGVRRAILVVALLPVAALAPAHVALWGWRVAGYHALVGALYALVVVLAFFNGLAKIPFTATYVSGRLKLKSRFGYYLFGTIALTALPAALERQVLRAGLGPLVPVVALAILAACLAVSRWRRERALPGLVFDDSLDDAFQTLRLSE